MKKIVIIVVIVLVLGLVGYIWYKKREEKKETDPNIGGDLTKDEQKLNQEVVKQEAQKTTIGNATELAKRIFDASPNKLTIQSNAVKMSHFQDMINAGLNKIKNRADYFAVSKEYEKLKRTGESGKTLITDLHYVFKNVTGVPSAIDKIASEGWGLKYNRDTNKWSFNG